MTASQLNRREFLRATGGTALLAAMHGPAWALDGRGGKPAARSVDEHLILGVRLQTATPLEEMRNFYGDLLGFKIITSSANELIVETGNSRITFVPAPQAVERPFYHFAFNIPENKLRAARKWQLARTPLIPPNADIVDPEYGADVWHFRHWNAHSIFFWDPADNIVEYIARHELKTAAAGDFSLNDIHYVSEIGLMVDDQGRSAAEIEKHLGLASYPPGNDQPWAMGDAHGLLLCLSRGRIWGTRDKKRRFDEFPTEATIRGTRAMEYTMTGRPYKIIVR